MGAGAGARPQARALLPIEATLAQAPPMQPHTAGSGAPAPPARNWSTPGLIHPRPGPPHAGRRTSPKGFAIAALPLIPAASHTLHPCLRWRAAPCAPPWAPGH